MKISFLTLIIFIFSGYSIYAQYLLSGQVIDEKNQPISSVNVRVDESNKGTTTNVNGEFRLKLSTGSYTLTFSHIGFEPVERVINVRDGDLNVVVQMQESTTYLEQLEISDQKVAFPRPNLIKIDPRSAKLAPSAFNDFSKILVTLPGVTSNNELSNTYSVRGGNFDENLVYVNDIPIYRPFLIRAGRQEGLSFINPDLVGDVAFYAGGWEPRYGDRLSSVLSVDYKKPTEFGGSLTLGLLGGAFHLQGNHLNNRVKYSVGVRRKSSQYLLNTLEVNGQYLPRFTDIQSYANFDVGKKRNKTQLGVLFSYARNRYLTQPENQETEFGTFQQSFRFLVAFEGQEILNYDTYQTGIKLTHHFNDRLRLEVINAGVYTQEREYFEVEGGYRLCDVDNDPGSESFNDCVITRGIGTNFAFGRNKLEARIFNHETRLNFLWRSNQEFEMGLGYTNESIDDRLNEFEFVDSADFSTITDQRFNQIDLNSNRIKGYFQNSSFYFDSLHVMTVGVRFHYWDLNDQLLVSPRFQYTFRSSPLSATTYNFSLGSYQQPPFYRELRDRQGEINLDVEAQSSIHLTLGMDHVFQMWGRNFLFRSELYYKWLYNLNPYDIDNVRIRYFATNNANGFARGIDFRVNGEFIKGTQSWFSLGLLQTREDISGDGIGSLRRPSDQRVNIGVFFEDHIPSDPSIRVFLNFLFGSGLPFGPPGNDDFRNSFSGPEYFRGDIGFSKIFSFKESARMKSVWVGLEVLNVFGVDNTISYTWIEDFNNNQFAIPNSLSARFLNIKLITNF